jgi:hypothetical protein
LGSAGFEKAPRMKSVFYLLRLTGKPFHRYQIASALKMQKTPQNGPKDLILECCND